MADPLALNDIVQITVTGSYEAQVLLNVMHYKAENAPDPGRTYEQGLTDLVAAIKNDVASNWVPSLLDCMGQEAGIDKIRAQRVYPTRDYYVDVTEAQPGTHANPVRTANIAATLTKQSSRAGRGRSGSFHVFGVPEGTFDLGRFLAAYMELLDTLSVNLKKTQVEHLGFSVWYPGMYNGSLGTPLNWSDIVQITPQDTVRIMRRRTLRVGI
jgi:hypothetical protein